MFGSAPADGAGLLPVADQVTPLIAALARSSIVVIANSLRLDPSAGPERAAATTTAGAEVPA